MKPRILDLFCGAGGCSVGYARAGFDVVGVDLHPQPNYPYAFEQADALHVLRMILNRVIQAPDAIHSSPPCQAHTRAGTLRPENENTHPRLIAPTRELLKATGLPWVIENVPGAPMRRDLILCGSMFDLKADGFGLRRHRWFEFSDPSIAPALVLGCDHSLPAMPVFGHNPNADWMKRHGRSMPVEFRREAMGIDWMTRDELSESVPPAFTEFIGHQLAQYLNTKVVA